MPTSAPWQNRILRTGEARPAELMNNPKNWRVHPKAQADALAGVLSEVGWLATVIVNETTGRIVDGHLRVALALQRGEARLPVSYVQLTEAEEALALATFDPIGALAEMDRTRLDALLAEVRTDNQALQALLDAMAAPPAAPAPAPTGPYDEAAHAEQDAATDEAAADALDRADEALARWRVAPGDLWLIESQTRPGQAHRIVCGDSTSPAVIDRLMDGHRAVLCWTDPPWNVAYGKSKNPRWKLREIENDDLGADFLPFCRAFVAAILRATQPGALLYLVMSAQEWPTIDRALREGGFHWPSTIIWAKDRFVLSRKDYHTQYEPLWYGWREDGPRLRQVESRTESDVWPLPRPGRSEEHPTMKPIALIKKSLANSTLPDDLVFDPFGGSGSTLLAAEELGRRACLSELAPKYVAVTLDRATQAGLSVRRAE